MPELTVQELQNVVVAQRQELDAIRAEQTRVQADSALRAAIATSGVSLHEGVVEQVAALLRGDVSLVPHNGQVVPTGPALKPLDAHVRERLASSEFSHFRRAGSSSIGSTGGSNQAQHQAAPSFGAEQQPGESLGSFVVRRTLEARQGTAGRDAQVDMGVPFGLRRK